MGNIKEKARNISDDRYYAFRMAQAIILDKLEINWKDEMFQNGFSLEEKLIKTLN